MIAKDSLMLAGGEKSNDCQEGCRFPPADNYFNLQSIYSYRQEGVELKKIIIPTLCACGCNEIVWNNNTFIYGHNLMFNRNGFKKGHVPWNTGIPRSEETKKKLSLAFKGRKLSEEHKKKISLGSKGRIHSEKARRLWSLAQKGRTLSEERRKKISATLKGRYVGEKNPWYKRGHSEEVRRKLSEINKGRASPNRGKHFSEEERAKHSGENHPNWRGGISFEPYCPKFNGSLKERIRERDNRTCQLCGAKENSTKLSVHHIHYDKPNCNPDLITLCKSCNSKVNTNRDYWELFFMEKLRRQVRCAVVEERV